MYHIYTHVTLMVGDVSPSKTCRSSLNYTRIDRSYRDPLDDAKLGREKSG